MRKPSFTDEDIIRIGNDLLARGTNPSPFAIKSKMGGGNTVRIKKVWEAHCESLSAAKEALPAIDLSERLQSELAVVTDVLTARVSDMVTGLYVSGLNEAISREQTALDQVDQIKRTSAAELLEASDEIERLELLLQEAKVAFDGLQSELDAKVAECNEKDLEISTLTERCASLSAQLVEAHDMTEDARRHEQAARERESTLNGQLMSAIQQHEDDLVQAQRLRAELKTAQTQHAEASALASSTEQSLNAALSANALLTQRIEGLVIEHATQFGRANHAESQLAESNSNYLAAFSEAADLRGQVKQLNSSLAELTADLKAANKRAAELKTAKKPVAKKPGAADQG